MTEPSETGKKQRSRDPKNIASFLLVMIAVIMLALLVRNCVTGGREEPTSDSESAELARSVGYADESAYLIGSIRANNLVN